LRSKAVFEQDLLAIREKKRPKPAAVVTEEDRVIDDLMNGAAADKVEIKVEAGPSEEGQNEDHIMEDLPDGGDQTTIDEPAKVKQDETVLIDTSPVPKEEQPPAAEAKIESPEISKPQETTTTATEVPNPDPQTTYQPQEEVPMSAGTQDLNFDSMFDAPTGDGGDINAADLDFLNDFKVDSVADGSAGNNDLNSLLPGLESYANATGDDFTMIFPPATNNADGTMQANKTTRSMFDGMDMGADLPAEESNFDDLFLDEGGLGGNADDLFNDASLGEIGDFDEHLFDDLS
jgi:hypothetical protein